MSRKLKSFVEDVFGSTAMEYALLGSLIAVFIISALSRVGTQVGRVFSEVAGSIK